MKMVVTFEEKVITLMVYVYVWVLMKESDEQMSRRIHKSDDMGTGDVSRQRMIEEESSG